MAAEYPFRPCGIHHNSRCTPISFQGLSFDESWTDKGHADSGLFPKMEPATATDLDFDVLRSIFHGYFSQATSVFTLVAFQK